MGRTSALQLGKLVHRIVLVRIDVLVIAVLIVDGLAPFGCLLHIEHPYHIVIRQPHVPGSLTCTVKSLVYRRHKVHKFRAALEQIPEQRIVTRIAIHVRALNLRLAVNVPIVFQQTVIVKPENGIIIVIDEEPYLSVLRSKHGVLCDLVHTAETHQIDVVGSHLIGVKVLFPFAVELVLVSLARIHPCIERLQVACVLIGIGVSSLESVSPIGVKPVRVSREQPVRITRIELLPALHA